MKRLAYLSAITLLLICCGKKENPEVAVESISLNRSTITLEVATSEVLTATVLPSNATEKTVIWSSTDTNIATVEAGRVTGVAPGSVEITVKCGAATAKCSVTVIASARAIQLDKTEIVLDVEETETLVATVEPANTTDAVVWSSSDDTVASVKDGLVTAVAPGNAQITVKAGSQSAICSVTVKEPFPVAIDMGLSVKWANVNVGANVPEEYGDHFAWGELETYYETGYALSSSPVWKEGKSSGYDWSSYKWCMGSSNTLIKYNVNGSYGDVDNKTVLEITDDVAHAKFGRKWRIPTDEEWTELRENCSISWTSRSGVTGMLVTSNKNGESLFLPAASNGLDLMTVGGTGTVGYIGRYWSSSLNQKTPTLAYYYCISHGYGIERLNDGQRYDGLSVRAVTH